MGVDQDPLSFYGQIAPPKIWRQVAFALPFVAKKIINIYTN